MSYWEQKITSELKNVSQVCKGARLFLETLGVENSVCTNIEIILTEALNNIIIHAYGRKTGQPINVEIEKEGKIIKIALTDKGESRKEIEYKNADFDPEDIENLPESGWGLFIIEKLSGSTEYISSGGNNKFIVSVEE